MCFFAEVQSIFLTIKLLSYFINEDNIVRGDGLKYREVATILDISVKTVEAHLATAVKKLRETLLTDTD
jgi:hypothetical protein